MALHALAGKPVPAELLPDTARIEREYFDNRPDPSDPDQLVTFGTSGHRGSPLRGTFTEKHILAITQAVCDYRQQAGISGPLYLGKDTHAASAPAERTALEVLAANGVETFLQRDDGFTPTPAISHAILAFNSAHEIRRADGIVITPSHNPPEDGGIKYNPPHGGPADTDVTAWIEARANELLRDDNRGVRRQSVESALAAPTTCIYDFIEPYVDSLNEVIDLEAVRTSGVHIGVDPLGGAALHYWAAIRARWGIDLTVVNERVDPAFGFMTLDHDGRIRMDCSSPQAMVGLVGLKERFDVAFGNDPDADRHGIVTPSAGLMNPNHYLAVAIHYLLTHRPGWPAAARIGKTLVSSSLIDRVVAALGRRIYEVPVGFKWFAGGLLDGSLCFGGEESAGASFVRRDGRAWCTDKDGLLLGLLAAEITAVTGADPGAYYHVLTEQFGAPCYRRIDAAATPEQKRAFRKLTPDHVKARTLAGDPIIARLTRAPGNGADIGGLKIATEKGWFAARPSGTEDIYKIYAESFVGTGHLEAIITEAETIVAAALG
jgi:phosphoglucomutase